ncbi:MAG: ABC transporter substrate-binding protein [Patescibacteria group bacterium]|nr:ABC transporter substrate-binding protein [Patescibacteria group bacterium]
MKTQKSTAVILAVIAIVISATAYFLYQSKTPEVETEKVPTVTIAYLPSDHHSALFIAAENPELFKEKGVYLKSIVDKERYEFYADGKKTANLKIVLAKKGGAEAMTLMEQGHSDINLNGAPPTIFFIDKGTKAKIVSPLQAEGSAIVIEKDNPSENWTEFISWIKSNEGQEKIGFPLTTSIQKVMLESALKASGVSYSENPAKKTDVLIIDMKGQGTMLTSLEKGDINAVIAWQPTPAIIIDREVGKIIAYSKDLPPEGVWKNHVCCVMVASDEMIKEKREILKDFLKLMMISTNIINESPDLAVKASSKWLGVEEEVEKIAIPNIKFSMEIDEEWFSGNYTFVKEMDNLGKLDGKLKGLEDSEEIKNVLFDFSVYEEAKKEIGI